ncbi:F0F1 ATP synthase subunit A [Foetidibacter luteolus]|uniref:F0F1 ATP synthase subunit A n=1 Tax=Foetidibacter luteolus TaxID=2608880 RepID=UPI00129A2CC8|nr:F0F1 ATP synthase subunit A [Foetidibacter luteolus]
MALRCMKYLLAAAFSLSMVFFSNSSFSQDQHENGEQQAPHEAPAEGEGEFNVTETILEHIKDSHSWHLWGHTSLPLPVILHTDKGFEAFSSAKLMNEHHEPVAYQGNYLYKVVEGKIKIVDEAGTVNEEESKKLLDISITKNVASMFLTVILLLLIFISVANAYKKRGVTSAPKGFQSFIEPIILFVRDEIAKPYLGHKYAKYMPFLLTVFFFIWINNLLGLIPIFPGGSNVSGNIAFTMTLAVFTFIIVNVNGKKDYWKHIFWMPGLPTAMKIFLMPIELLGVFIKPVSLMIRLFANITAGHILVMSLICLIFIFKAVAASAMAVPFAVFINAIELLVAFLQAFIFTMLSALYIGMAIEEHHEHELA